MHRREILGLCATFALSGFTGFMGFGAAEASPMRLVLKGYDPVAYFTLGTPTPGLEAFEAVVDGSKYRFANADHLQLFEADPDAYMPQYSGHCTGAVSMGFKVEADPDKWRIVDGKLYVFRGWVDPTFDDNPQAVIARADEKWPGLQERSR